MDLGFWYQAGFLVVLAWGVWEMTWLPPAFIVVFGGNLWYFFCLLIVAAMWPVMLPLAIAFKLKPGWFQ